LIGRTNLERDRETKHASLQETRSFFLRRSLTKSLQLASHPAAAAAAAARDVSDAMYAVLYQLNAAHKASNYSVINRRRSRRSAPELVAAVLDDRHVPASVIGRRLLTGIDCVQ